MRNKMLATIKLDQRMMMSQQLRQAITLLQYNTLDLKQLIQHSIETNPLLELEESEIYEKQIYENLDNSVQSQYSAEAIKYTATPYSYDDENELENYSIPKSLRAHLLEQLLLCRFDQMKYQIAEAIIDAIDDKGYLTMPLIDIQQLISTDTQPSMESIEEVLSVIQTFEPLGIGARTVQECLLLQLDGLSEKNTTWEIACKIIEKNFEAIASNNKKIARQFNVTQNEYEEAIMLIKTLNPNPGGLYASQSQLSSDPELYVERRKEGWCVFLTESILTNVKINRQYQDLIKENKKHGSYSALKHELEEARFLLRGLNRRNETLLSVAKYIVGRQKEFLEQGPMCMKAMNIADVAQALNLHESTISRVTNGKYIATPRGVFELKYFFPSHVTTRSGSICSATAVKALIKNIISEETANHIFSDSEIAEQLKAQGINVARRTVTKYREAMKVLPSYQRQAKAAIAT